MNCFADSCAGKNPGRTGWGGDAWSAALYKVAGVYVESRYSDACKAAWCRISWGHSGDIARVVGEGGAGPTRTRSTTTPTPSARWSQRQAPQRPRHVFCSPPWGPRLHLPGRHSAPHRAPEPAHLGHHLRGGWPEVGEITERPSRHHSGGRDPRRSVDAPRVPGDGHKGQEMSNDLQLLPVLLHGDTFPMTSHVECVLILEPAAKGHLTCWFPDFPESGPVASTCFDGRTAWSTWRSLTITKEC
ncbi:DUF2690 domain-containing protein [Streptomyces sp. NPDC007251]|uniref:DUF2690 domain-containing protein n=1 Tax=Streptomyces sp. NPDC007251 TaxID=3154483 RepID=UPI0033E9DDA0